MYEWEMIALSNSESSPQSYDLIVIGGGPAGLFAAFYGGMRQASVKIIESMPQLGGQLAALYPEKYIYDVAGFPKITAQELVNQLIEQLALFKPTICLEEKVVDVIKHEERSFEIKTTVGTHYAKAIIITAGVGAFEPKKLALPEAAMYEGSSLHYFVNDLERFRGRNVLISGGGDSAVDWSLMLEHVAQSVTLVHRRDQFRAHEHSVEQLIKSAVKVITPVEIVGLHSKNNTDGSIKQLSAVTLQHVKTNDLTILEIDDVIVNFGFLSSLGPIADWGIRIDKNSITVDSRMETSIPGIFAAGDITTYPGKVKLIAVGFGEAPTAVNNAKVYIDPAAKLSPGHSSNMKL